MILRSVVEPSPMAMISVEMARGGIRRNRSPGDSTSVRLSGAVAHAATVTVLGAMAVLAPIDRNTSSIGAAAAMTMLIMLMGATAASVDSVPCGASRGAGSTTTMIVTVVMAFSFAVDYSGSRPRGLA